MHPDLEGLFININIVSHVCPLGLAEEDEVLEEEHPPDAPLPPVEHCELILANQLTLLLQVHLGGGAQPGSDWI